MLRIAIKDDHKLFRKSLALLINHFEDMEVVLEASNGLELLEKLKTTSVDVLLLDLEMPEMDGFETYRNIKELYPDIKTIVLSMLDESDTIRQVVKMGVQGYFTKNTPIEELEEAIWKLEDDGFYFEKGLAHVIQAILENTESDTENKEFTFTDRELEVLKLTAKGVKTKDIADSLNISTKTVNTHKQNIQQKYGFKNVISAVLYAVKMGIIDINAINFKK